jgi:hypothetical protein
VEKPEEDSSLRKAVRRRENNMNMDITEIGRGALWFGRIRLKIGIIGELL